MRSGKCAMEKARACAAFYNPGRIGTGVSALKQRLNERRLSVQANFRVYPLQVAADCVNAQRRPPGGLRGLAAFRE